MRRGGNVAASVSFLKAADIFQLPNATSSQLDAADNAIEKGVQDATIHFGFETVMLLIVVVTVSFVGAASARRIHAALRALLQEVHNVQENSTHQRHNTAAGALDERQLRLVKSAMQQGRQLRLHIMSTCAAIFFSFLVRAAYITMFAIVSALQDSGITCAAYTNRCSSCYNSYDHALIWLLYTPSLHFR